MTHLENVWTGRNDVTLQQKCVDRSKDDVITSTGMSKSRGEKISTKDIFSQRYGSKLGFSLDVISLLVSQFDIP